VFCSASVKKCGLRRALLVAAVWERCIFGFVGQYGNEKGGGRGGEGISEQALSTSLFFTESMAIHTTCLGNLRDEANFHESM
jgi:hypothetical protein